MAPPAQHGVSDENESIGHVRDLAIRWLDKDMDAVAFTESFHELCEKHEILQQCLIEIKKIQTANNTCINHCLELGGRVSSSPWINGAPRYQEVIDFRIKLIRNMEIMNRKAVNLMSNTIEVTEKQLQATASSLASIVNQWNGPYEDEAIFATLRMCNIDCEWMQREIPRTVATLAGMGHQIEKHGNALSGFL
ncbi:hypothetical protein FBULB1_14095 [Fusarium bulbicola]|nr:hypothetical protein FBULB1_14095 [Fusarium bulbicola]